MASTDILNLLEKRITKLEKFAKEVECLGKELLQKTPVDRDQPDNDYHSRHWGVLDSDLGNLQREALRKYQRYYTSAFQLVQEYLPEKESEFAEHYHRIGVGYGDSGVMAFLQLHCYVPSDQKRRDRLIPGFINEFEIQRSILLSIPDVFETKELTLRRILSADLAEREIEQAEMLFENDFKRAAGAIAGVALELYLRTQCDLKGITYKPKATLNTYISELYKNQVIEITEKNALETLASIRNKCSHPEKVHEREVRDLIDGVRKKV